MKSRICPFAYRRSPVALLVWSNHLGNPSLVVEHIARIHGPRVPSLTAWYGTLGWVAVLEPGPRRRARVSRALGSRSAPVMVSPVNRASHS